MNKITGLVVLIICMMCYGCKTISRIDIYLERDKNFHRVNSIAVMRFDDKLIQERMVKGVFIKTITSSDAGETLAAMTEVALQKLGQYQVISRTNIKERLGAMNVSEKDIVSQKDYKLVSKTFGVDAVIFGKILEYKLSSALVYERGRVAFIAECIDTNTGKTLWTIEADESSAYLDEIELASKAIRKSIRKLGKEIGYSE